MTLSLSPGESVRAAVEREVPRVSGRLGGCSRGGATDSDPASPSPETLSGCRVVA